MSDEREAAAAAAHVRALSTGYIVSAALHAAASLDVASHLVEGPRDADALAAATGADADALCRVLRALAAHGMFKQLAPRVFGLNAAARCLLPPKDGDNGSAGRSVRDITLWMSDPFHLRVHGEGMLLSTRSGVPAAQQLLGAPIFEYLAADKPLARSFNAAMGALSAVVIEAVLESYDFSGIAVLADVGGCQGALLRSVLAAHPHMRGILLDLPHVVAGAPPMPRCDIVGADFFQPLPEAVASCDAVVMKHIIHDWDDSHALTILRNVAHALRGAGPRARLLLLERVLLEPAGGADAATPTCDDDAAAVRAKQQAACLLDLEMLVLAGGRERTAPEFGALLARAGFALTRVLHTRAELAVLEARLATAEEARA